MNLDELKETWRAEMQTSSTDNELRTHRIQGDMAEFNREVGFGTYVMIVANVCGCLLGVVFGWLLLDHVRVEQKLALSVYVLATIWMTYRLLRARHVLRSDDWTLRARLEMEIERLERQRGLWKSGGLWLLVPLAIYCALSLPVRLYPVPIVVGALAYWLVRRNVRSRIDPLLSRLRGLYRELVESGP
jgi:hypothetical protein